MLLLDKHRRSMGATVSISFVIALELKIKFFEQSLSGRAFSSKFIEKQLKLESENHSRKISFSIPMGKSFFLPPSLNCFPFAVIFFFVSPLRLWFCTKETLVVNEKAYRSKKALMCLNWFLFGSPALNVRKMGKESSDELMRKRENMCSSVHYTRLTRLTYFSLLILQLTWKSSTFSSVEADWCFCGTWWQVLWRIE